MAIFLTEELIQNLVHEINVMRPAHQFEWQRYLVGNVRDGRRRVPLIFLENPDWFALLYLAPFNVSKIKSVNFIAKDEIEGLEFNKEKNNYILKMRQANAEFLKMYFPLKSGGKHCHLGKTNLVHYEKRFKSEYTQKTDMPEWNERPVFNIIMLFTFYAIIFGGLFLILIVEKKWLAILGTVLTMSVFLFFGIFGEVFFAKLRDWRFYEEYMALHKGLKDDDSVAYLQGLKQISHKPVTPYFQSYYYGELVKHAHLVGQDEEAQEYLASFPRDHSGMTAKVYQELLQFLATPKEEIEVKIHK
ncbi:hypothetical protein [Streptococcus moroccensis]|uniref:Uncharacterized protein n=1 Tax=Streptococcus moroccensis TaxID=1451356 RepID=A0ABT9YT34_9STRE|nr:hypothetical protein [Streptococcus moroccensis]MDQ0222290.1 hypothetical protein [Streptococcus moroccensis]